MKTLYIILITFSLLHSQVPLNNKIPKAVNYVDIKKFSGLWYEIARTYNTFEKDCVAATVEYKLIKDTTYEIKNRCFDTKIGGNIIEYNGIAKPFSKGNMAEIQMTYFWIFSKEYKVVYLSQDYSSAVIVDASMENVWIMNREPFMKKQKLEKLVSFLAKYMDTSKLIYTPQDSQGRYK